MLSEYFAHGIQRYCTVNKHLSSHVQFSRAFSGKLLLHFTFNRNVRNFWPTGRHPSSALHFPVFSILLWPEIHLQDHNVSAD